MKHADRSMDEYDLPHMCSFRALVRRTHKHYKLERWRNMRTFWLSSFWKWFLRNAIPVCRVYFPLSSTNISLLAWYCSSRPFRKATLRAVFPFTNIRVSHCSFINGSIRGYVKSGVGYVWLAMSHPWVTAALRGGQAETRSRDIGYYVGH